MDYLFRRYDELLMKPLIAVMLTHVHVYDAAMRGSIARHKLSKLRRQSIIQESKFSLNRNINSRTQDKTLMSQLNITLSNIKENALVDVTNTLISVKKLGSLVNHENLQLIQPNSNKLNQCIIDLQVKQHCEQFYPKRPDYFLFFYTKLSPNILLYSLIINALLYFINSEIYAQYKDGGLIDAFGIAIDCFLPGRIIWTGSITRNGRYVATSTLAFVFVFNIFLKTKSAVYNLGIIDFLFASEDEVREKQFNCAKTTSIIDGQHLYVASKNYSHQTNSFFKHHAFHKRIEFDLNYHLKTSPFKDMQVLPKLNRDLLCKFHVQMYARITIISYQIIFFSCTILLVLYVLLFSTTAEGEALSHPICTSWHSPDRQDLLTLSKTKQTDTNLNLEGYTVAIQSHILSNPLILFHTLINLVYCFWTFAELIFYLFTCGWLIGLAIFDTITYCWRIKTDLIRLLYKIGYEIDQQKYVTGSKSFKLSEETQFLCLVTNQQLLTYFQQIEHYNVALITPTICLIFFTSIPPIIIFGLSLITNTPITDPEVYVVCLIMLLGVIIMFIPLSMIHKASHGLYTQIASVAALCCSDKEISMKYINVLTFFKPKPEYCFHIGNEALSAFFFLKHISFICSAFVFIYSVTLTRNYDAPTIDTRN